ncbi:hypothetical protein MIMGU_mgv1a021352mg, partial [Erythranthe guttata]
MDGVVIFIMFYSILMISLIDCIESLQKRTKTEYRLRRRVVLRRCVVRRRRSSKESTIVSPAVRVVESAEKNLLKEDEKIVCVERDPEGQEITENLNREDSRGLDTRSLTYGEYSCEKLGAFDRKPYFSGIVANNGDYVRTQNLVIDQESHSRGGFSGISENNVDGICENSGIIDDQESDSCSECSSIFENNGDKSDSCSECSSTSANDVDDICETSGIIEDDNNSNGEGEEEFVDDWEGIETTELEKIFGEALVFASSKSNSDRIGDLKLQLYGLQKVALDGPCHVSPPMAFKISARSKWNAWQKLGSMSRETAMEMYVDVLSKAIPNWKK